MTVGMLAAGLMLAPAAAIAQSTQPETNTPANTTATETIGPRGLEEFNLNGTVTQAPEAPGASAPAPSANRPASTARQPAQAASTGRADSREPPNTARTASQRVAPPPATTRPVTPAQSLTLDLPPATPSARVLPSSVPAPGFAPSTETVPGTLAPETGAPLWPWLLLAAVVGLAAAILIRRRRSTEAYAGGPQIEAFVAPEPPAPAPRAAAPPASPPVQPKPVGVVSSRLRPWLDIEFVPVACVIDQEQVTFEFEVHLFNSGSAPARDILVEAWMFNAGPTQDKEVGAFFARPPGPGDRTPLVPPLQRMTIHTSLSARRADFRAVELGGKQVFVPLIAFNATYASAGGEGRTSACYMLGRQGKGDKLAPFSVNAKPGTFNDLGAKALPIAVRR